MFKGRKIIDFKYNKKRSIVIIVSSILAIVLLILTIGVFVFSDKKSQLDKYLETMGSEFYENYYYEKIGTDLEERSAFLKEFETIGIKVNLDTLSKYNGTKNDEMISKFVNKKTKEKCDMKKTKVVFYPRDPYKAESYVMETIIECD